MVVSPLIFLFVSIKPELFQSSSPSRFSCFPRCLAIFLPIRQSVLSNCFTLQSTLSLSIKWRMGFFTSFLFSFLPTSTLLLPSIPRLLQKICKSRAPLSPAQDLGRTRPPISHLWSLALQHLE